MAVTNPIMHVTHQSGKDREISSAWRSPPLSGSTTSHHSQRVGRSPVSYYLCKRGGVPVKERIIFYTTRQREEVG